ncbi:MAG TPA: NAD(+)/NADH kinase [Ignavibacteria bacterium]|nr:NAD(+)/NADH kinase [Ignavibacteria bacterium]
MTSKKQNNKLLKIGIVVNTTKDAGIDIVSLLIKKLRVKGFTFYITDKVKEVKDKLTEKISDKSFLSIDNLCKKSDLIISIGGDGTMLATAYQAQFYDKPVFGINAGKLGFLVEAELSQLDLFIDEIKNGKYTIDERMIITAECIGHNVERMYAINDFVIDKGAWPKIIEITIKVDGDFVTTFSADGLIIATPTGSTGYSVSTGGPIVNPKADVISLCPISPHSLNIRPLVLASNQEIIITADSPYKDVHINCDGQRVFAFPPPITVRINKSKKPFKLVHTSINNYFETLRNKLMWGIDLRNKNGNNGV